MSSRYGLTEDQALAQIMELDDMIDKDERRRSIYRILAKVRSLGYHDGSEDERINSMNDDY
jgi:hypothetical protein